MKNLKAFFAEFIGTFVLVFCACGVAACTSGSLVATALTFGLVIVAMAYSIGRISGCHINPAVSIAMLVSGKMSVKDFCLYVVAQILGGFVGAVAIFGFAKMGGIDLVGNACNGPVGGELTAGGIFSALLVEIVLTFIFVYVILNVTDAKSEATKNTAGIIIGLTLTLVHLLGINLTGTSVNPARSLATALGAAIFNLGDSTLALQSVWIFIVAPLVGGVVAAVVFKALHNEKEEEAK